MCHLQIPAFEKELEFIIYTLDWFLLIFTFLSSPPDQMDRFADFLSALMGDSNQDFKREPPLTEEIAQSSLENVCLQYCKVLQDLSNVS